MPTFELDGYEVINGNATASGNGAHVHVPKKWIGASVKVVRASEIEEDSAERMAVLLRFEGDDDIVDAMTESEIEQYGVSGDQILSESDLVMEKSNLPAPAKYALGKQRTQMLPQPGMEGPE